MSLKELIKGKYSNENWTNEEVDGYFKAITDVEDLIKKNIEEHKKDCAYCLLESENKGECQFVKFGKELLGED